jgi:hypothetical protein
MAGAMAIAGARVARRLPGPDRLRQAEQRSGVAAEDGGLALG